MVKSIHTEDVTKVLKEHGIQNPEAMKGSMQDALRYELFSKGGLDPNANISRTPYHKLWPKLKTAGKGGLAVLGAAMEYKHLRETGHEPAESLAQAGGSGLGSLATPGGWAGLVLSLGTTGLEAAGAPKQVTASTQSAGDVLNFTGAALGQVARADINIKKGLLQGDWKAFDRQMKEMVHGKAGVPLEGFARSVDIGADIAPTVVDQVYAALLGKTSAKEATGKIGERMQSVFLKQKFEGAEKDLWNATAAPMAMRQIKLAEGLIRGKEFKTAFGESQQMEKDAPINKAIDWMGVQKAQFIKRDLPEAATFAKKDLQGFLSKGKAQLAKFIPRTQPQGAGPSKDESKEASPAIPPPSGEAGQGLEAQVKEKSEPMAHAVAEKYRQAKGLFTENFQKGKELFGKRWPLS
jgi:hypothetical protein